MSGIKNPDGFLRGTVTLVGGPADGEVYGVSRESEYITVAVLPPKSLEIDESDPLKLDDIIVWDDYGPKYKPNIQQARYRIIGAFAYYEENE